MGRRKSSLLNAIPSTRLLGKVQNLVDRNLALSHATEDTNSSSAMDFAMKDVSDSEAVVGCSKSSSVSRTLGENDTETDCSSEKLQEEAGKSNEHMVLDQIPDPEKKPGSWVNLLKDNRNQEQGFKPKFYENQAEEIVIEHSDVLDVDSAWGCCLVGYIAGLELCSFPLAT